MLAISEQEGNLGFMKLIIASILAALASFAWGYISWMQLSWHETGMRDFKDENAVAEVIKDNAGYGKGIYMLPFPHKPLEFTEQEEQERVVIAKHEKAFEEGPYMYAIVRPGKRDGDMAQNLIRSYIRSFIACLIAGALLMPLVLNYWARVAYIAALGAFAGLAVDMQQWIWFELPTRDLIVNMTDHFIEWTLAGCILALFLGKEPTVRDLH